MPQDVTLKIHNRQYSESLEPEGEAFKRTLFLEDEIEVMTEATVYHRNGATYISYEESEETGFENVKTVLKVEPEALTIRRYADGENEAADIKLEAGVVSFTRYSVQGHSLDVEVYTNNLSHMLGDDGCGTIKADYNIKLDDKLSARNMLEIQVLRS